MKKTMNIPIFIPHNGCPNDCVFCNQRKISGSMNAPTPKETEETIKEWIVDLENKQEVEIAFFGGSFTGLPFHEQAMYLEIATKYVKKYNLKGIRMSTRPDYINIEVMEFLSRYPISAIELGVQSLQDDVLMATRRNHTVKDVYLAVDLIKKHQIELGLQMMIGLPKDTKKGVINTARQLIQLEPKSIRIYPTVVIAETELAKMYYEGSYKPLSVQEAVELTSVILPMFVSENITVLRVGLQANEALDSDGYITGPYHPAFKELVEDQMVFSYIMQVIEENITQKQSETISALEIAAGNRLYQRLVGHKKANKKRLNEQGIVISLDNSIQNGNFVLVSENRRLIFTIVL